MRARSMNIHQQEDFALSVSRRSFLRQSAYGLGGLAFGCLAAGEARADTKEAVWDSKGVILKPQDPVRAKRIIHLCMAGGPSAFETFDHKPKLNELHGQPFPTSLTKGQQLAQLQGSTLKVFGSKANLKKYGKSGQEIADYFPNIGGIADEICIVRSMIT